MQAVQILADIVNDIPMSQALFFFIVSHFMIANSERMRIDVTYAKSSLIGPERSRLSSHHIS